MRCTQFIGLADRANVWLQENGMQVPTDPMCPHCDKRIGETTDIKREFREGNALGMFEEDVAVHKYWLKDGSVVSEYAQASPWSSGPMIFTALMREDGSVVEESLWTEDEIESTVG